LTWDEQFDEWVTGQWPRLVRSAVLLGCTTQEAEDLVQTTLERCLLKWAKVSRADDREAYVHRMVVNGFISSRRRRWHGERPTEVLPEVATEDRTRQVDEADRVRRALGRLTPEQRAVVVLRHFSMLSERDTATALGVAPGTVKSRLSRALAALAVDPDLDDLEASR
jgi:RNA polymerase sigma-70 factor (sigma-E family)